MFIQIILFLNLGRSDLVKVLENRISKASFGAYGKKIYIFAAEINHLDNYGASNICHKKSALRRV